MAFIRRVNGSNGSFTGSSFTGPTMQLDAGDLAIVVINLGGVGSGSNIPTTVVDTLGNTYTSHSPDGTNILFTNGNIFPTFGINSSMWYCPNVIGGTGQLNVTLLASLSGSWDLTWFDYSDVLAVAPVVGHGLSGGSSGAPPTISQVTTSDATATPGTHNILFASAYAADGSNLGVITGSSFTARWVNGAFNWIGEQPSTAPGGETFSANVSNNNRFILLAMVFALAPTLTISGSTGVPGVTVTWFDTTHSTTGSVVADGSGNYVISGLIPSTYEVAPFDTLHTFSPGLAIITLTTNTVQNFTPTTLGPSTCTSTQIGADSFTRANENPLNPATWQQFGGNPPLQIVSNRVEGTVASGPFPGTFNGEQFIATWPTNVFTQITINTLTADGASNVEFDVRSDSLANNSFIEQVIRNLDGSFSIQVFDSNNPTQGLYIFELAVTLPAVFRFELFGSIVRFFLNGVLTGVGDTGNSASYGTFGSLAMEGSSVTSDAQASLFSFGSVTCTGGGSGNRVWVSPLISSSIEKGNA